MPIVQQNGGSMDTLRLGAMMSILDQRKVRAYYTSIYATFNTNSHFKYTAYTVRYFLVFTLLADERCILMDKSEVFPKSQFIYLLFWIVLEQWLEKIEVVRWKWYISTYILKYQKKSEHWIRMNVVGVNLP